MNDYLSLLKTRHTTKKFDPERTISDNDIATIKQILQLSPSSTNSQPWHFFITGTAKGKQRIAKATHGFYEFNTPKIINASHVVVLCTKSSIDMEYTTAILAQEDHDRRFSSEEVKQANRKGREFFTNLHITEFQDAHHWMEKQTFIALGNLLIGAAHLGIQACPMEGFDYGTLSTELSLPEKGYVPTAIVSLGYGSKDDFNARTPKSRWPLDRIITEI